MGAQASGDVEPVRWHALTTDRDGAPQRVKGVRGNPPLAGTYADLCACCCSREKIHHCTVCKETRPAFLMAMAPAPNQGQVATKCVRCAREQGQGGVVAIVPTLDTKTSPPTDIVLLDSTKGSLYPIKEKVKPFGFTYVRDFNGIPGADYWVAPATGLDTEALAALLDDWGWAATIYDGAD